MTWDELDLEEHVWTLARSRTKNGKPHIVHLSQPAMRVIKARERTAAYVFASGQKAFSGFSNHKPPLDQASSVSDWRLHDLRRTAVSGMARLGVPPHVADKILNHA